MCGLLTVLMSLGGTTALAQVPPEPARAGSPVPEDAPAPPDPAATQRYDGGIEDVENALARSQDASPIEARSSRSLRATRYRGVSVRDRERPDFDAVGLRAAGFHLLPRIGVEAGYDGNVFATANRRSDVYARPFAEVIATSDWTRHALRLEGDVSDRHYSRFQTENGAEYRL